MDIKIDFNHKMAAHCETGTLVGLLEYAGFEISEPMAFGIAHGIFFGYFESKNFPFPTFIVRSRPGNIRENLAKDLKIKIEKDKFKSPEDGMRKLDTLLEQKQPVGTQVDFFYMDYLPEWVRVHNNVHFINVVGKQGDDYVISDSYHRSQALLNSQLLQRARWAGGYMAPKGFMYYPTHIPQNIVLDKAIEKGIKKACWNMLKIPMPFLGVKGIYKFADKINTWPSMVRDVEHLSHEIMKINILLEDQGTGGAGFRFMYATFLKQAGNLLNNASLNELSEKMMLIGDDWRNISYFAAKIGKKRELSAANIKELSNMVRRQGDAEKLFFSELRKVF